MQVVGEDELCRAVMLRLLDHADRGFVVNQSFVERGSGNVKRAVQKYRNASKAIAHVVLTDLDQAACVPTMLNDWGVVGAPDSLLFRVAVREVESWLLADAEGLSSFIGVLAHRVPAAPELLADPKQVLVNLARRSRRKSVIADLVPAAGSRVPIGPLYNERLGAFVRAGWNVQRAAAVAPSLARTVHRLQTFLA